MKPGKLYEVMPAAWGVTLRTGSTFDAPGALAFHGEGQAQGSWALTELNRLMLSLGWMVCADVRTGSLNDGAIREST
jgi:hypothetical protein